MSAGVRGIFNASLNSISVTNGFRRVVDVHNFVDSSKTGTDQTDE